MSDEIDRLEIVVEAEANKANRALSGMEKRLDRVADSLAKVMLLANKGFDMNKFFGTSTGEKKAEQLGKRMADDLIKGFNLDRAGSEVKRQVRNLSNSIANGLYSGGKNKSYISDMDKLGDVIKRNGSVAENVSSDYKELYDTIRAIGKIRISPETAKSLGDDYKDRSGILKSKMSTGTGIELDSIYQELKGRFSDILPDVSNTEDQFYAINDSVREFISLRDQAFRKVNEDEAYEAVAKSVEDLNTELRVAKAESDAFNSSLSEMKSLSESFKFDFSGLDKAKASLDSALNSGKKSTAPRVKRADLKYTETSLDDLYDKYSNVGKNIDVSGMGLSELERELKKSENAAVRFNDSLDKKLAIEQPKVLGKAFESLVYDIQKATNQAEIFREAITQLSGDVSNLKIEHWDDGLPVGTAEEIEREADAIEDISDSANKATEEVKQLNSELSKTGQGLNEIGNSQNPFKRFANGALDFFKMDENGSVNMFKKIKDAALDMASGVLNAFKLADNGSMNLTNSIKSLAGNAGKSLGGKLKGDKANISMGRRESDLKKSIRLAKSELKKMYKNNAGMDGDLLNDKDFARQYSDLIDMEKELKLIQKILSTKPSNGLENSFKRISKNVKSSINNVKKFGSALKNAYLLPVRFGKAAINILSKFGNKIASIAKSARNMAKAFATPIAQVGRLKNAIFGLQQQTNKGMSWGRMWCGIKKVDSLFSRIS